METIKIFNYNEAPVTFKLGDTTMVNATQMAKPFGESKSPKFWLSNQQTNEFLTEFSKVRILTLTDLVQVTKGGNNPSTWMHEDVALEFARWLSPLFAIWCNDRIKELLRTSMVIKNESPGRYDVSRNILPGVHSPEARMIGEHSIWTICIDNTLFYRLKDILNAAGIYEHKRKETSKNWFRSYVYWINDRTGTCPKRYINEAGVLFLFSRTRTNKGDPRARQFLASFMRQAERNKLITAMPGDPRLKRTNGDIDLEEFLNVIISTQESEKRKFLYELYNKLLVIRQPWKN